MPAKSSALDKARSALAEQIAALDAERDQLQRALDQLGGAPARRGRPRGSASQPKARGRRRAGGRGGSAPRRDQALRLIKANPGIRPSELARKMGVAAPYIYRVVPPLVDEGKVKRDGKGFVAA
jgi:hypothetical protein